MLTQVAWDTYRGLQVVIDSQQTPDGCLEAGTLVLGSCHVVGADWSWGRVIECEARVTRDVRRDGIDRVSLDGPPTRTLEMAMVDGIDTTRATGGAPTPDVLSTSMTPGTRPGASVQSWPSDLTGLYQALNGPLTPVVYLDAIKKGDDQVINRMDRMMLGRITSPIRRENRVGLPGIDETVNIATVVITEVA